MLFDIFLSESTILSMKLYPNRNPLNSELHHNRVRPTRPSLAVTEYSGFIPMHLRVK